MSHVSDVILLLCDEKTFFYIFLIMLKFEMLFLIRENYIDMRFRLIRNSRMNNKTDLIAKYIYTHHKYIYR